ncbi:MAG: glycosyltransferase family 2 protein [Eubacterium sp.]|nr:glycosyltransferase family 2 protein [Eubacterium sp.]
MEKNSLELSIVMPCLNEEKTVGHCIDEAKKFIEKKEINAEIIVVDNGSTDDSEKEAAKHGAKVIREDRPGYGRAIRRGLKSARGSVIIICDCDMTYDLYHLEDILEPLKNGEYDVMIGYRKCSEKGAIRLSHRIGAGGLSALGRLKYHTDVKDFHCGLRGLTSEANRELKLRTKGMEFATEMIAKAAQNNLNIGQTEVSLKKCPYGRESKLRTIRDGFRHLVYILFF